MGTVTAVTAAVGTGVLAGQGYRRVQDVATTAEARPVWFHVHPPHVSLWGARGPVSIDRSLVDRLSAGMRSESRPVLATAPPPRPVGPVQRTYAGLAALGRPSTRCLVGVSGPGGALMPWAAAGCGLLAREIPVLPAAAQVVSGTVVADPLPGWMVGTDGGGIPVTVNLPPGSTVVICGEGGPGLVETLPATGRCEGGDVTVVDGTGQRVDDLVSRWRDAWHPQSCRVVLAPSPTVPVGVYADVVVDVDVGELRCGHRVTGFRPLPLF